MTLAKLDARVARAVRDGHATVLQHSPEAPVIGIDSWSPYVHRCGPLEPIRSHRAHRHGAESQNWKLSCAQNAKTPVFCGRPARSARSDL